RSGVASALGDGLAPSTALAAGVLMARSNRKTDAPIVAWGPRKPARRPCRSGGSRDRLPGFLWWLPSRASGRGWGRGFRRSYRGAVPGLGLEGAAEGAVPGSGLEGAAEGGCFRVRFGGRGGGPG